MDVSVVLINYKTPDFTIQCIQSIIDFTTKIEYEIIVIDNDSKDDSQQKIKARFPNIIYIESNENVGFSRANNMGIKIARGNYVLILNNDTIFIEDILPSLVQIMETKKNIAASCVQLYYEDKTKQLSGSNFVIGGFNMLLTLPYMKELTSWMAGIMKVKKPHPSQATGIEEVDWISGAFMFVRTENIKKSGDFDEDFFLFSEEVEWCFRLKKTGSIVICPELSIIHIGGKTMTSVLQANETNYFPLWEKKGLQLMLSHLLRIKKQYSGALMLMHFFIYVFEIFVFFFGILIDTIFYFNNRKQTIKQAAEYSINVFRLIKFIPAILFNKHQLYKVY